MFDSFYQLSDFEIFILISAFILCLTTLAVFLIRRVLPMHLRYRDNAVIGNIASTVGVIYGVLVGLTALYLFNNNSYTSDAVQREANAVANIYRDSKWLKNPARDNIQMDIKNYIKKVIDIEWPLMERNKDLNHEGDDIIDAMDAQLHQYAENTDADKLILRDITEEIKKLYDARQQRMNMSSSQLSPEIWAVVLIGTFLTIGINFLFRVSFSLHLIAITAAGLMTSSMLFLLVTLDRPFQGEFIIEPTALQSVLTFVESQHGAS